MATGGFTGTTGFGDDKRFEKIELALERLYRRVASLQNTSGTQQPAGGIGAAPAPDPGPPPATGGSAVDVQQAGAVVVQAVDAINLVSGATVAVNASDPATADVTVQGATHPLLDANIDSDTVAHAPVKGDLIYADGTPDWNALAIGGANKVLQSVSGLPSWQTLTSSGVGASSGATVGGFLRLNVQNSGAVAVQVPRAGRATAILIPVRLVGSGHITGISVAIENPVAGGGSYSVSPFLNGVTTGITANIITAASTAEGTGSVAFNDGDFLTVFDLITGTVTNTDAAEMTVFLQFS